MPGMLDPACIVATQRVATRAAFALADFLEKIRTEDSERDRGDSSTLNRVESALYGLLAEQPPLAHQ
jgi:hypothetical protein